MPVTLTANMLFQSSRFDSVSGCMPNPGSGMPALPHITSTRPNFSTVVATRRSMSASTRTSASMPMASPPASMTSCATAFARPGTTSMTTMRAPSDENSSAASRPRPEDEPVIAMTLSCTRIFGRFSLFVLARRAGDRFDPKVLTEAVDAVLHTVAADAIAAERRVGAEVEHHVDATELLDRRRDQALHVGFHADIGVDANGFTACIDDQLRHCLRPPRYDIDDHDAGTFRREQQCRFAAQAGG